MERSCAVSHFTLLWIRHDHDSLIAVLWSDVTANRLVSRLLLQYWMASKLFVGEKEVLWKHYSLMYSIGHRVSFSSVQFSSVHSVMSNSLWPHGLQRTGLPCPSPTPRVYSNSCTLSQWCHPTISSSVIPYSSRLQSFPASGSFPMSQMFASCCQSIGVSASASVLPMNSQDWFPLGWTGWISLQSKGLSRVFSNTTVQKHQFFGAQLSSQPNSHIHTWPLEKP